MFKEMDGNSLDLQKENINKLKYLFPEVVTDGNKIDFSKLKDLMSNELDEDNEKYNFTWNGKRNAIKSVNIPSQGTLIPNKGKSKNWDKTKNLYIEGDNFEVLKLLQKSYANKIQVIYIDPPYNTGNDFVYKDNFKDNIDNYLEQTNQVDENGNKQSTNSESNGRFHTDWLNMMYPRLRLAKNLLTEEGVIYISISDNEQSRLKMICDEIFGDNNFVGMFVVKARSQPINSGKAKFKPQNELEYVLLYGKNKNNIKYNRVASGEKREYPLELKDKGKYRLENLLKSNRGESNRKTMRFTIDGFTPSEDQRWQASEKTIKSLKEDDRLEFKEGVPHKRIFENDDTEKYLPIYNFIDPQISSTSSAGKTELNELIGNFHNFDTVKPTSLIKYLINMVSKPNDIVLDFFSGSGTTADSIMQLNKEKNMSLKYILVQLPEKLEKNTKVYSKGYKTITDIAEERIRRAGNNITNGKENLIDDGFKVFELADSNIKKWNTNYINQTGQLDLISQLNSMTNNFVDGRTSDDIVYELLLKQGIELTDSVEKEDCNGYEIYSVNNGALYIVLGSEIRSDVVDKIVNKKSIFEHDLSTVVMQDIGFMNDSDKLNVFEGLRSSGFKDDNLFTV